MWGMRSLGVFRSTNNGTNWIQPSTNFGYNWVYALAVSGADLFAGAAGGVHLSTDNGATWTVVDSGLTQTGITSLIVDSSNIFAGMGVTGVWRRALSEIITAVQPLSSDPPSEFALKQNYPNPFNPSTVIAYSLPVSAMVSLKVYDVLGREMKTLVAERQNAGEHSAAFNGNNLLSGVYFYMLQAGTYHEMKKMLLLK